MELNFLENDDWFVVTGYYQITCSLYDVNDWQSQIKITAHALESLWGATLVQVPVTNWWLRYKVAASVLAAGHLVEGPVDGRCHFVTFAEL